jgi:hypothetical protein
MNAQNRMEMMSITALRLFEVDEQGNLLTLFHGLDTTKSRVVPQGEWIQAKQKLVRDGGHQWYRAGFHTFSPNLDPEQFVRSKFRRKRIIVIAEVQIRGRVRKKPTNPNVWLVQEMYVPTEPKILLTIIPGEN